MNKYKVIYLDKFGNKQEIVVEERSVVRASCLVKEKFEVINVLEVEEL